MIEVRSIYNDWKEVSKEQAKEYIKYVLSSGITCYDINKCESNDTAIPKLYRYIERTKLRGITVEELLKEEEND